MWIRVLLRAAEVVEDVMKAGAVAERVDLRAIMEDVVGVEDEEEVW